MKANVVGDLLDDNILVFQQTTSGTTPIVCDVCDLNNLDGCGFQFINEAASGPTNVTGTWKVEVSQNYISSMRPNLNQGAQVGTTKWSDITSQFTPTIVNPSGSPLSQFVQAYPLLARFVRVTFTPTSGTGVITVLYCGKGTR